MPRPKNAIPRPHFHKTTGQARIRFNGKDTYLGPWGSTEAEAAYKRFVAVLISGPPAQAAGVSVAELAERYTAHAAQKYQPRHVAKLNAVIDIVLSLYGTIQATDFGPSKLRAVQSYLANGGLGPTTVNQRITMLRKMFKWAVGWELVPGHIAHALREVEGMKAPPAIARPAPEADVAAALPFMPKNIAAMVQIQRLTGMRPGEICGLSIAELHKDKPTPGTWLYVPAKHKNAHHGHIREILIGPAAQLLLLPWLEHREPGEFVFRPCDSLPWKPKRNRKRKVNDRYSTEAYDKAVLRACDAAGVKRWSPNMLRHSAATRITAEFGRETAQVILGHKTLEMTGRYVQGDLAKAAEAMRKAG